MSTCLDEKLPAQIYSCREEFIESCIPNNGEDITALWNDSPQCMHMLRRSGSDEWVRSAMDEIFYKVMRDDIRPPGGQSPGQDFLYFTCSETPEACRDALLSICSKFSMEDLNDNPEREEFCGCYLPSIEYSREQSLFGVDRQCSSICTDRRAVKYADISGTRRECSRDICIISDITLNLERSNIGDVSISQMCGNCQGAGRCECNITGINLDAIQGNVGDLNLEQSCGVIGCYETDPEDPTRIVKVPCSKKETRNFVKYLLIGLVSAGIILAILLAAVSPRRRTRKGPPSSSRGIKETTISPINSTASREMGRDGMERQRYGSIPGSLKLETSKTYIGGC